MKKEIVTCDVCEQRIDFYEDQKTFTVIFRDEQKGCNILLRKTLDVCHECKEKIVNGNPLYGSGYPSEILKYWIVDIQKELHDLRGWKKYAMELWGPIIEFMQTKTGITPGASISDEVLRILKQHYGIQ